MTLRRCQCIDPGCLDWHGAEVHALSLTVPAQTLCHIKAQAWLQLVLHQQILSATEASLVKEALLSGKGLVGSLACLQPAALWWVTFMITDSAQCRHSPSAELLRGCPPPLMAPTRPTCTQASTVGHILACRNQCPTLIMTSRKGDRWHRLGSLANPRICQT